MKIKVESFSAAYAKKWFKKNYAVFIATAYFKGGEEVIGQEKKTRALAIANVKKELGGEGVANMFRILGGKP